MSNSPKEQFYQIIINWNLPYYATKALFKILEKSKTPREFEYKVLELSHKLKQVRKLSDYYNDNWHSEHCECNECLGIKRMAWRIDF